MGRNRKIDPDELRDLLKQFDNQIVPLCRENNFSLHKAFEYCREKDPEKLKILNGLYSTLARREYLKDYFRREGGVLREKKSEKP